MVRRITLLLATMSCLAFSQAAKNAEEAFKNITHLKGTPADELMPAMQFMSASLGVQCAFCHVQGKMDADDIDHKKIARNMIAMTASLNKASFNGRQDITCYTCHQGAMRPNGVPPVEAPFAAQRNAPPPAPATPAPAVKSADEIVSRYIAALGGEDAIRKITSRIQKGDLEAGGVNTPIEIYTQAPNKRVSISQGAHGADSITAFDGTSGWMGSTGRPARPMAPAESWAASLDAEFYFPLRIKELFAGQPMRVSRAAASVNGFACDLVTATAANGLPVRLYFNRETGLLARVVRFAQTPVGRNQTQIDYSDYRPSDGVMLPFRWTLARPNGRFAIQVATVQNNAAIDPAKFAKP
jgi:hypothetical protein